MFRSNILAYAPLPKLPHVPLTQERLWLLSCLYGFHRSEIEQMTGWSSNEIEQEIETWVFNDRHSELCKHAARELRKHFSERYGLPLDEVWRTPVPTLHAQLREALFTNAESRALAWEDLGTAGPLDAAMPLWRLEPLYDLAPSASEPITPLRPQTRERQPPRSLADLRPHAFLL